MKVAVEDHFVPCYLGTIWGVTAAARACVVQRVVRVTLMTEKNTVTWNPKHQASMCVCVCRGCVVRMHVRPPRLMYAANGTSETHGK